MDFFLLPPGWLVMAIYFLSLELVFRTPTGDPYDSVFIRLQLGLFFPSTEINMSELDQIAGIVGGALTLLVSIYDVTKGRDIIRTTFQRWWPG